MSEKHAFVPWTDGTCAASVPGGLIGGEYRCGQPRSAACHAQGEAVDFGGIKFVSKAHMPDGEFAIVGGEPNPLIVRGITPTPAASPPEREHTMLARVAALIEQPLDFVAHHLDDRSVRRILALAERAERAERVVAAARRLFDFCSYSQGKNPSYDGAVDRMSDALEEYDNAD
jgi:hypothetical protein